MFTLSCFDYLHLVPTTNGRFCFRSHVFIIMFVTCLFVTISILRGNGCCLSSWSFQNGRAIVPLHSPGITTLQLAAERGLSCLAPLVSSATVASLQ